MFIEVLRQKVASDVLYGHPRLGGQRCRSLAHAIA
jgi:hypothetical protein